MKRGVRDSTRLHLGADELGEACPRCGGTMFYNHRDGRRIPRYMPRRLRCVSCKARQNARYAAEHDRRAYFSAWRYCMRWYADTFGHRWEERGEVFGFRLMQRSALDLRVEVERVIAGVLRGEDTVGDYRGYFKHFPFSMADCDELTPEPVTLGACLAFVTNGDTK
jgi:ribosomal protein S27AE